MREAIGFVAVIITVITTNIWLYNSLHAGMDDLEEALEGVGIELIGNSSEICD